MKELEERVKILENDVRIYQELGRRYKEAEGILLSVLVAHSSLYHSDRYDTLCKECIELRKQLSSYKEQEDE